MYEYGESYGHCGHSGSFWRVDSHAVLAHDSSALDAWESQSATGEYAHLEQFLETYVYVGRRD